MKYRVIKKMSKWEIGDIVSDDGYEALIGHFLELIQDGFLKEIKEESLEDKFREFLNWGGQNEFKIGSLGRLSQIAKSHILEVFDNNLKCMCKCPHCKRNVVTTRKAIEDA